MPLHGAVGSYLGSRIMGHKFRYRRGPAGLWLDGQTAQPCWDVYVRRFFTQFPDGELEWLGEV